MENNVYVLYNKLSQRYGDVVAYPTDAFALARLQQTLRGQLSEYELCKIGSISVETGTIKPQPPLRINWMDAALNSLPQGAIPEPGNLESNEMTQQN